MTVQEAINRGNNLLATSIAALAGFAFTPEAFIEDHPLYKVDDALLFWIGIGAIVWYWVGKNRYTRSIAPVLFVLGGLLVKIIGLMIEFKDKDDAGDDFGGLLLFVLASILVVWIFITSKKLLDASKK